jgi:Peptidase family M1 domain
MLAACLLVFSVVAAFELDEPPSVTGFAPSPFPQDTGMVDHERCEIDIRLSPSRHFLQARTLVAFRSLVAGLGRVQFVIYDDTLRISSVTSGTDTLGFSYDPGTKTLTVQLADTLGQGERDTVVVDYSGYITSAMGSYCRLDNTVGFSMLPYAWYPAAYDLYYSSRRDDFSTWRLTLTVPRNWRGLSCGVLLDSTFTDSTATYVWQPTRGYVAVSFGAGPYQMATREWGGLQLRYYDSDTLAAVTQYGIVGTVLDYLTRTFGQVTLDKLAFFDHRASFGAAHPSLVMMPLPNQLYPMAHEVGHHWWGISVTRRYDSETWLNEGFATYMSALLYEDSLGVAARDEALDTMAARYLAIPSTQDRAIVPAPWTSPHCTTILYSKGAWVLHMLRGVLGDSAFSQGMKTYAQTFRDSVVVIDDFRHVMEQAGGRALDWFFNEWLYWTGAPSYEYWWSAESLGPDRFRVTTGIEQRGALFTMPVQVSAFSAGVPRDTWAWVDGGADTVRFEVAARPDSVVLDREDWILNRATQLVGTAEESPDAGRRLPAATIVRGVLYYAGLGTRTELPGGNSVMSRAGLLDAAGRKVLDLHPGANDVHSLAPGVYFVRDGSRSPRVDDSYAKVLIAK